MIKIGAARQVQPLKQLSQTVFFSQGVNQLRLLPIAQEWQVDAQVFFWFIRVLQQVVFKLQIANVAPELFDLPLQFVPIRL
ncbi:hypothetical protein WJ24_14365 [Burkholderia vietnamiensis]|nr:hypothetical protein WJ24_14365 [Burkholderia vietnamiensis]